MSLDRGRGAVEAVGANARARPAGARRAPSRHGARPEPDAVQAGAGTAQARARRGGYRRLIYDGPTLGVATGETRKAWAAPPTAPVEGWQSG